jgi:hypothetical protein
LYTLSGEIETFDSVSDGYHRPTPGYTQYDLDVDTMVVFSAMILDAPTSDYPEIPDDGVTVHDLGSYGYNLTDWADLQDYSPDASSYYGSWWEEWSELETAPLYSIRLYSPFPPQYHTFPGDTASTALFNYPSETYVGDEYGLISGDNEYSFSVAGWYGIWIYIQAVNTDETLTGVPTMTSTDEIITYGTFQPHALNKCGSLYIIRAETDTVLTFSVTGATGTAVIDFKNMTVFVLDEFVATSEILHDVLNEGFGGPA